MEQQRTWLSLAQGHDTRAARLGSVVATADRWQVLEECGMLELLSLRRVKVTELVDRDKERKGDSKARVVQTGRSFGFPPMEVHDLLRQVLKRSTLFFPGPGK